ncbi:MAG: VWA domain-containing protein [Calditrichaeota bacterium]|nr:VWA domain-containing protein [Calditrichota bacterium]
MTMLQNKPWPSDNGQAGTLSQHLVAFCRLLRAHGVQTGVADAIETLRALQWIDIAQRDQFYTALKLLLAKNQREVELFDRLFWEFWLQKPSRKKATREEETSRQSKAPPASSRQKQAWERQILNWADPDPAEDEMSVAGYSPIRVLTYRDFSQFRFDEMQEIINLINWIARNLAVQFGRRLRQTHRFDRFDFRRTIRRNLRRGGEIVDLSFQTRKRQKFRLLLLCDVSKSMELYSRFLLQFIYAFQNVYRSIETFVFSTSILRISEILRHGDAQTVLSRLAREFPEWSGGTRIGESLEQFLQHYSGFYLDSRTIVMILSDGWDTGEVEKLSCAMEEIQRRSAYVIWLNPLMGYEAYEPSCRGMQAALPYVDLLAPVHNVESLKSLIHTLIQMRRKSGVLKRARRVTHLDLSIRERGSIS